LDGQDDFQGRWLSLAMELSANACRANAGSGRQGLGPTAMAYRRVRRVAGTVRVARG